MKDDEQVIRAKVIVLGNAGIGKSCLIGVFSDRTFDEVVYDCGATVGCDFVAKKMTLPNNQVVKLNIWDTMGLERYRSLNRSLYHGSSGALICFDLTQKIANEDIDSWKKDVQDHAGPKCSIVLVGTKSDMEIIPETRETLEMYAKTNGFQFIETSSKTGVNVKEAFRVLVNDMIAAGSTKIDRTKDNPAFSLSMPDISRNPMQEKSGCC